MKPLFWLCVLAASAYVGWTHAHTDEVPVVLGFILILSALVSGFFSHPLIVGFLTGVPVFTVETLVHFHFVQAPYPPSAGIPWPALFAFIPAFGGAFLGAAVRKLNKA